MKKRIILAVSISVVLIFSIVWAATQWSDYDELTAGTIADGDDFLLRDVSDTTMAATGTQKRYLWSSVNTLLAAPGDDTWQGKRMTVTAGESVSQWDLLYGKNASGTLKWYKYDADSTDKLYSPRAIALAAISADASGLVGIGDGICRNDGWSMTSNQDEGKPVYASADTAGALTLTAPSTSGDQVCRVGYVLEENVILFSLGNVTLVEVQ